MVESMRTRKLAPSPAGAVLQGSMVKEEPADDAAGMHTEKKQRVEGLDAVAIADASEGPSRYSSPPAKLATDAAVSAGAHAKQPVNSEHGVMIGLQPQSRRLDSLEGLSGNSYITANHAEDEEGEEGQSSFSRDSPEGQADEGEDDDDEEEAKEDANEVGGVEDSGLANLLGEELEEIYTDLPSVPKTAGTGEPLASTKCTHCGEIHSTYAKQCEVAHHLFDKIMTAIKSHDEGIVPKNIKDFELYILVPSLSSLYNQTVNRLNEFVENVRQRKSDGKIMGLFCVV